jgi:hypothetical protein
MAGSFTLPTVLANLAAGNEPLSLIDGDFTSVYNPLVSLNTFSNFYSDVGAANAYAITVSSPQTVTQSAGLRVQFQAAHANTGASTLQINALAVKNILNPNGTALASGQIPVNAIVDVMFDGTQYLLLSAAPLFSIANALGGDVALNNTANYFDGPSAAQGTVGTWSASGNIVVTDTAGAASISVKLWDGTTVISSGIVQTNAAGQLETIHLSGVLTSPAGNIRISAKDVSSTNGVIKFNATGNSKDAVVTAIRIG